MQQIKTVFNINGEDYAIAATGQEAVNNLRQQFPKPHIVIKGFMFGEVFKPVNLFTLNKAQRS